MTDSVRSKKVRKRNEAKRIKLLEKFMILQEIERKNDNFNSVVIRMKTNACFQIIDSLNEYFYRIENLFLIFYLK